MIYLSANGEVLGQFEEAAVPALLKEGRITPAAFYWREGMPAWRPVSELPLAAKTEPASHPVPPKPIAAAQQQNPPEAGAEKVVLPVRTPATAPGVTKPGQPSPAPAALASVPTPQPRARIAADPSEPKPAAAQAGTPAPAVAPPPAAAELGGRRRAWIVRAMVVLFLAATAAGGAWWWINREPPSIPGRVALSGDESGPVEVRVFRPTDLAASWRDRLAASDARAAELEKILVHARGRHREKLLLYEEAARVCEVGEEYNMPDVEQLRADRDAKKADAEASKAELDKLQAEKDKLFALEGLLQTVPQPVSTVVAESTGDFTLPALEEGEFVALATAVAEVDGRLEPRGWLVALEMPAAGSPPSAVEVSAGNRLDVEAIRRFTGGYGPQ